MAYARCGNHSLYFNGSLFVALCLYPRSPNCWQVFNSNIIKTPREFLAQATGVAARAHAAQLNSFESLPLFVAAVLMAEYMVVPDHVVIKLSLAYLLLRIFLWHLLYGQLGNTAQHYLVIVDGLSPLFY